MSRILLAGCFLIAATVRPAEAQFEVGVRGGVHVDRSSHPDRIVTDRGASMYAAAGEASAIGAQAGYWVRPALGLQLDLSRSSNASWSGSTPVPPPPFANRTTYVSARGIARTSPARPLQLLVAAGPALMLHSGTGESLRTRNTDFGGVLEAGARLRIAGRLGMQLALTNYVYSSRYTGAAGGSWQHDFLISTGLVFAGR